MYSCATARCSGKCIGKRPSSAVLCCRFIRLGSRHRSDRYQAKWHDTSYPTESSYVLGSCSKHDTIVVDYWIDALCIDQTNIAERNQLVRNMGMVYYQASLALVWLGTNQGRLGTLLKISRDFTVELPWDNNKFSLGLNEKEFSRFAEICRRYYCDTHKFLLAWEELAQNQYWTRAWILQEFLLNSKVQICTDTASASHDALQNAKQYLFRLPETLQRGSQQEEEAKQIRFLWSLRCIIQRDRVPGNIGSRHGLSCLTIPGLCSDIRDGIYSKLSLLENGSSFHVDYSEDVFTFFLRTYIFCCCYNGKKDWGDVLTAFKELPKMLHIGKFEVWRRLALAKTDGTVPRAVLCTLEETAIEMTDDFHGGIYDWPPESCHTVCEHCSKVVRSFDRPPVLNKYCCLRDNGTEFHLSFTAASSKLCGEEDKHMYFHSKVFHGAYAQRDRIWTGNPRKIQLNLVTCILLSHLIVAIEVLQELASELEPSDDGSKCKVCDSSVKFLGQGAMHYREFLDM